MNTILKAKIVEIFGTQSDFAKAINVSETIVSRVVRQRQKIKDCEQNTWAKILNCKPSDIFSEKENVCRHQGCIGKL